MKTSEVLDKAADVIQRDGWGVASPGLLCGSVPHCALGAIGMAGGYDATARDFAGRPRFSMPLIADTSAGQALAAHLGVIGYRGVYTWNDAEGRTAEQVIATLRAAAVIEAARESGTTPTTSPTPAEVSL